MEQFVPFEVHDIENVDELRSFANPLRLDILDHLIEQESTVKEIADTLGVEPNNLYYHIKELERVGLIRVTREELVSGIQQKHYRAVAQYFRLSPTLLLTNGRIDHDAAGQTFITGAVERSLLNLRRSLANGLQDHQLEALTVSRRVTRMSVKDAAEFRRRLKELEEEFANSPVEEGEPTFELQFALFPHTNRKLP